MSFHELFVLGWSGAVSRIGKIMLYAASLQVQDGFFHDFVFSSDIFFEKRQRRSSFLLTLISVVCRSFNRVWANLTEQLEQKNLTNLAIE